MGSYRLKYRINGKEDIRVFFNEDGFYLNLKGFFSVASLHQTISIQNEPSQAIGYRPKKNKSFDTWFKTHYPEKQTKWVLAD